MNTNLKTDLTVEELDDLYNPNPIYHTKYIPDPIPQELSDVWSLDTLISGYWEIPVGGETLYPTVVAHKGVCNNSWLPIAEALKRSVLYFKSIKGHIRDGAYYEDDLVKVFVSYKNNSR